MTVAPLIFAMPSNEPLSTKLADDLDYELGHWDTRQFLLPLVFVAATARELGASAASS